MLRRDFIAGLGGAVLWPAVARLQPAELPLIGFLHEASAESYAANAAAFAEGLKQGGFAEARDLPWTIASPAAMRSSWPRLPPIWCEAKLH